MNVVFPGAGAKLTQVMIFKQLWLYTPRRSFVSGLYLREYESSPFFLNIFAHVLPKAKNKYPYFKYYAGNIVLLTPSEHVLWDNGTEEQRINYALDMEEKTGGKGTADWDKIKKLRDDLIVLYKKTFPTTHHGIINYKYSPDEIVRKVGKLNEKFWDEVKKKRGI